MIVITWAYQTRRERAEGKRIDRGVRKKAKIHHWNHPGSDK